MYLIVSTLPHLLSALPVIQYYYTYTCVYTNIILLSSTCSVLYHFYEESNEVITVLDYGLAFLWFVCDIYMGYTYTDRCVLILALNGMSLALNVLIPYDHTYSVTHSLWHLVNAAKCYYVSYLIGQASPTRFVLPTPKSTHCILRDP